MPTNAVPATHYRRHCKMEGAGERIVLFMDHNEHVYNWMLGKTLRDRE